VTAVPAAGDVRPGTLAVLIGPAAAGKSAIAADWPRPAVICLVERIARADKVLARVPHRCLPRGCLAAGPRRTRR